MDTRSYSGVTVLFSARVANVSTQCEVFGNVTPVHGVEINSTGRLSRPRIANGVPSPKMKAGPDDRERGLAA